jgi:hypothetical protein
LSVASLNGTNSLVLSIVNEPSESGKIFMVQKCGEIHYRNTICRSASSRINIKSKMVKVSRAVPP